MGLRLVGDGRMDLYIGDSGLDAPPFPGYANHLLVQNSAGHLVDESQTRLPPGSSFTHDLTVGDIDGDGDIELCCWIRILHQRRHGIFPGRHNSAPLSI